MVSFSDSFRDILKRYDKKTAVLLSKDKHIVPSLYEREFVLYNRFIYLFEYDKQIMKENLRKTCFELHVHMP